MSFIKTDRSNQAPYRRPLRSASTTTSDFPFENDGDARLEEDHSASASSQNVADDTTSILDNPNDKGKRAIGTRAKSENCPPSSKALDILSESSSDYAVECTNYHDVEIRLLPLKEEAQWQNSEFLKIETRMVRWGCAMAVILSPQKWEAWYWAENAGKDAQRLREEDERKKKEKEADEQKAKVPVSALLSESPPKSAPEPKFPGWAGLIVGWWLDSFFGGALSCCYCCFGTCIRLVMCPKCKGGEAGIGMDLLEQGGAGVVESTAEATVGLVDGETETASLPPYEEVEK